MVKSEEKLVTFEEQLEKLETLSKSISDENMSLDRSMEIFEEGITLATKLEKELEHYEKKVKILIEKDGETHLEEFK